MDNKFPPEKNLPAGYVPPKVWSPDTSSGGAFASTNRPVAGPTREEALPQGKHPLQLYSLGTPNGQKVTIMLEELLAAGHQDAEYDAWLINIGKGDQFTSGFVDVNPNSKIPALLDMKPKDGKAPLRIFESASIMVYLAEKFGAFLPKDLRKRTEAMNWLFWQMGSAPFLGGGFGHFYVYAPMKIEYAINRYAMEVKRQMDVLNRHLAHNEFMAGEEYSIADMAIWPWYGRLAEKQAYNDAGDFLSVDEYTHVQRWTKQIRARPATHRGSLVNRSEGEGVIKERHNAADFNNSPDGGWKARG